MLRKAKKVTGVFVAAAVISAALYFATGTAKVTADEQVWISIDATELSTIQREMGDTASKFDIDVTGITAGIAIARINSEGLAAISEQMHVSFRKCGGFIIHDSQDDAFLSVEKALSLKNRDRLGGYTIDNQANVNHLIPLTDDAKIQATISDLESYDTRRHDQPSAIESANYINNRWGQFAATRSDISVEFFDNTDQGPRSSPQPSVILTIDGTTFPDEVVVLGAHQDSIRSGNPTGTAPGADDDASGIACLTEVIRLLTEENFRPARTVKFMAYAAEEVGLRGSRNIAADYAANNVNVIGVLQLDMTNYTASSTVDVALINDSLHTNAAQNQFLRDLMDEYLPNLNYVNTSCGYACSDHASWQENGYVASFPFEAPFGQHNTSIHTGNDTLTQSGGDATHAEKFAKLAIAYATELAKGSIVQNGGNTPFDFDGDSKTDVSIFRPAPAEWWYLRSSDGGNFAAQFGTGTDVLAPADFTGDGKTDIAFFRDSTGEWFVLRSEDQSFYSFPFGSSGDIPAPGDFDGDGKADAAVFRPATSTWFISRSSDGGTKFQAFGATGDQPTVEDFDGDGSDDIAVYRPSVSEWWQLRSTEGVAAFQFGSGGDRTVSADFTGDGKADAAFWRPSTGFWYVLRSEDDSFYSFPFGQNGDIPVPGDYDGDGNADAAVFRPSSNTWFKLQSTSGFEAVGFGATGDVPLPSAFVRE